MINAINEELGKLSREEHDRALDAIKQGLKNAGGQECSLDALLNQKKLPEYREPEARCCGCQIVFTVEEIRKAGACPKCGHRGDFEVDLDESPNETKLSDEAGRGQI